MKVISLGWGVQSFALAAMSALGVLPKVDAAIHADTTHERSETYAFARKWTPWLEERGVRVVTVKADSYLTTIGGDRWVTPPFYSLGPKGEGMLFRTCTDRWKVRPIQKWLRKNYPDVSKFEKWLGITLDEIGRLKQSRGREIFIYPFIELLDRPWTRGMVMRWLLDNDLEIPVKSSCVFCPYRDMETWREIKRSGNGDWTKAIKADRAIRDMKPDYKCYLTRQCIPLEDVDFRNEEDHGQLSLWGEECSGMCFL